MFLLGRRCLGSEEGREIRIGLHIGSVMPLVLGVTDPL